MLEKVFKALPVLTTALAATVEPLEDNSCGFMGVGLQTLGVPEHSVVVVVTPELGIQDAEESLKR